MSWLGFAYPCLLIAYIGQAAYISSNAGAFSNPFFNSVPPGMFYPSLVVAILAAVVASQTMITATFQLLSQIIKLSYFPQIKVIHTSTKFFNQIYIPWVNWLLMIGTICVTAAYSNTTKLGEVCLPSQFYRSNCCIGSSSHEARRGRRSEPYSSLSPYIQYLSSHTEHTQMYWLTLVKH